ncbi:MAG TPA: DUF485 domain-containing protein [Planctomycetes bacterium]|nr:DUF485 domain-containing protein [Fuerstiella sp.]HIK91284.1 DUF485 domain-containing protein [Planctomycetota bacterium]
MESRNARLGLQLFCVYLVLYGGFVLLAAFSPATMEATPVAGINLAILYGFALIVGALVMALIYGAMCKGEPTAATATNDSAVDPQENGTEANAASTQEDTQ